VYLQITGLNQALALSKKRKIYMLFKHVCNLNRVKTIIVIFINSIFFIFTSIAIAGPNSNASCALDLDYTTPEIDTSLSVDANSDIWVAVIAQNVQNLDGCQVEIEYDPNRLQFLSGIEDNPMGGITNLLKKNEGSTVGFQAIEKSDGLINIANALAGNDINQAPEGDGVIAIIQFKVLDVQVDNYLNLSNVFFLDSQQTNESIAQLNNAVINPFVNTPPQISKIEDQMGLINEPIGPITFTIHDNETSADSLELSISSSNQKIIPDENIFINGIGSNKEIIINSSAKQTGISQINIFLSDGVYNVTHTFMLMIYEIAPINDLVSIAAGSAHNLALKNDGTILAWGSNYKGILGDSTTINRTTPVKVKGLNNVIAIDAGSYHSLALRKDGSVWTWGYNSRGQLGDSTTTDRLIPVQVKNLDNVTAISIGGYHSLALQKDGFVWTWGDNRSGQLGDSTTIDRHTPIKVKDLNNVIAIASAGSHSIALKIDGTVWAWGNNSEYQLGDSSTTDSATPIEVIGLNNVVAISAASFHNLALKDDGTIWGWGKGSCIYIKKATTIVKNLNDIVAISAGNSNNLALTSDGYIWEFRKKESLNCIYQAVQVKELNNVVSIACRYRTSLALNKNGTVWAWGSNIFGQLGHPCEYNTSIKQVKQLPDMYFDVNIDANASKEYPDKTIITWEATSENYSFLLFNIWRSNSYDFSTAQLIATEVSSPYTDNDKICGNYRYWIIPTILNEKYFCSDPVYGYQTLEAPTLTSASYRSYTDKISIAWKEIPCATEYQIWRIADVEPDNIANIANIAIEYITRITDNLFDDYQTIPERRYLYSIRAQDQYSSSDFSPLSISGMRRLPTPKIIRASNCEYKDRIIVEWEPVIWKYGKDDIFVEYYKITFFECDNNQVSESVTTGKTSYTFTNEIFSGRRYCFQVQAGSAFGVSDFSETTIGAMKLSEPVNVFANQGNGNTVLLSWDSANSVIGYEVYRTSTKNNPTDNNKISGASLVLTNTYRDHETSQRYYYWIKSKFENNDCGDTDQLFSEPVEGWPQNAQTKYFSKSWTGNPYNRMNLWIQSINGYIAKPGDEIAIYDGNLCVGSAIISYTISKSNTLLIETSQDDGRNNGFKTGNTMVIKIWDSTENSEIEVIPTFFDIESGQVLNIKTFEPVSEYALSLNADFLILEQTIPIQNGYNIISFNVDPIDKNLMTHVQPLINNNILYKIIDQSGSSILNAYGNWMNAIGNINLNRGYQIIVTEDTNLTISGLKFDLPKEIQLSKGWNIVGLPCEYSQTTQTLLKPLIDSGSLVKVIGHRGSILKVYGEGRDNLISFLPGEGYQIKVNDSSSILIDDKSLRKKSTRFSDDLQLSLFSKMSKNTSNKYQPIWEGNPYNRMNLWIIELSGYDYKTGDEIGVFDSNKCVGVAIIQGEMSKDAPLIITTSQDDGSQNGFINNNRIDLRIWESNKNREIRYLNLKFEQITDGKALPSQPTFKGTEDYGVKIDVPEIFINDVIISLQIFSGVKHAMNYPFIDIDQDNTISMAELLYLIQSMK